MSADATLTADIIIEFNEKLLKKFNKLIKQSEKSMTKIKKATDTVTGATKKNNEELKQNTKAQKENNTQGKKRASQATRTAAAFGSLSAQIAKVRVALGLVQFAASTVFKTLAFPAAIVTGWSAFLVGLSRGEKDMNRMAKSVQVGTEFLKAFSMTTKEANLSGDNAVDMLEEMSNKIGDGFDTPTPGTAMAFKLLGLNLIEVQKLSRQKALTKIMDSLVKFNRETGDDQRTVRLADEIFGGEGNKFAGFLLESGELFSELIEKNKEYNLVSNETSRIFADLGDSSEKTLGMFTGLLKEGLSENAEDLTGLFKGLQIWFRTNEDDLTESITNVGNTFTGMTAQILEFTAKNREGIMFGLDVALETMKNMFKLANGIANAMANTFGIMFDNQEQIKQMHSGKIANNLRRAQARRMSQNDADPLTEDEVADISRASRMNRRSRGSNRPLAGQAPKGDINIQIVSPDPLMAGEMVQQKLLEIEDNE